MTQDEQRIGALIKALVAVLRSRLNQGLNASGMGIARGGGSLVSIVIVAFLALHLFLFLNIALGFYLGQVSGGSPAYGFLMLGGIYLILLLAYLVVRGAVERRVRNGVARRVTHLTDNVNTRLDTLEALRVDEALREAYISGEPQPYHSLELRRHEAGIKAQKATREVQVEFAYIRTNYVSMMSKMAQSRLAESYPLLRFVTPAIELLTPSPKPSPSRGSTSPMASATEHTRLGKAIETIKPYMPYLKMAYSVIRPVATAFVVGRTQSWLLRLISGVGRKRK